MLVMLVRVVVPAEDCSEQHPDACISLLLMIWQLIWAVVSPAPCDGGKKAHRLQATVAVSQGMLSVGIGRAGAFRGRPCVRTCSMQMIPSLVHLSRNRGNGGEENRGKGERGESERGQSKSKHGHAGEETS